MIVSPTTLVSSSSSFFIPVSAGLIERLDNSIRLDLQKFSDSLFLWVWVSAIVVLVGVALEGPELLHEMWPNTFSIFSSRWVKKIGLIGWLLVVLGVAGEGIFEIVEYRAEGLLQTFNDILLADAQRSAGSARASAIDAANAASRADSESEKATASSANAMALAQGAKKEARSALADAVQLKSDLASVNSQLESAQKQLEAEKQTSAKAREETAHMESVLAQSVNLIANPRRVFLLEQGERGARRAALLAELKKYSGTSALIQSVADPSDREARELADIIGIVLGKDNCGWTVKVVPPDEPLLGALYHGIFGVQIMTVEQWPWGSPPVTHTFSPMEWYSLHSEAGRAAMILNEYLKLDLSTRVPDAGVEWAFGVSYDEDFRGEPWVEPGMSFLEEEEKQRGYHFKWPEKTVLILVGRKPNTDVYLAAPEQK
jgi:hypothetical protein